MAICRICGNETIGRRRTCSKSCDSKARSNGSKSKQVKSRIKEFDQIGKLTLLYKTYKKVGIKNPANDAYWYAICECGGTIHTRACTLTSGGTRSCGCLQADCARKNVKKAIEKQTKYGHEITNTNLFKRWRGILGRVLYMGEHNVNYKIYKGKGIDICDEWRDFYNFQTWAESSGFDPSLTIDRIDNSKGYSPDNCQWITMSENLKKRVLHKGRKPWLIGNKHGLKKS